MKCAEGRGCVLLGWGGTQVRKGLTLTQDGLKLKILPQLPKCRGTGCLPHPPELCTFIYSHRNPLLKLWDCM